jgi:poly(A) polymerase
MAETAHPIIRPRSEHPVSRDAIDPDALKVLYRLKHSGYRAYLVGGSVRDLLLGRRPKDFDVGTDARPEEIRALFRNSRLIGRRFRLAHILFRGGKVIEVATFRGRPETAEPSEPADDLLVVSDNTYGTPEEDALRRDFTVNGLFYNIADFSVIDFVGGLADLDAGLIRTIGDPDLRFREDPVRMLRAVEFSTRLSFAITPRDYAAIQRHRRELAKSAAPRVTDEIAAILRGGQALPTFLLLREMGLLEVLLPELAAELSGIDPGHSGGAGHAFWSLLEVLDAERRRGRQFDDVVSFAILVWPLLRAAVRRAGRPSPEPALVLTRLNETADSFALRLALPNALLHRVKAILFAQEKLRARPEWKASTRRLLFQADFPAALDLFEVAAMALGRDLNRFREWDALRHRVSQDGSGLASPPAPSGASAKPRRRRRGPRRRRIGVRRTN